MVFDDSDLAITGPNTKVTYRSELGLIISFVKVCLEVECFMLSCTS